MRSCQSAGLMDGRFVCKSCSLACGITDNPLKLTHDLYTRLGGSNIMVKWAQMPIWTHAHKRMHGTVSCEGTLNLPQNPKCTGCCGAAAFSFSHRGAAMTNSRPPQKWRVDTFGLSARQRLSRTLFRIKIIDAGRRDAGALAVSCKFTEASFFNRGSLDTNQNARFVHTWAVLPVAFERLH